MRGTFSWTGGTGKYAGIRGDGTFVDYSGEFLPVPTGNPIRLVSRDESVDARWRWAVFAN